MRKKIIYLIVIIILMIGGLAAYLTYAKKNGGSAIWSFFKTIKLGPAKEYNYRDVVYNFGGTVAGIEGSIISISMKIPELPKLPEAITSAVELADQVIKFRVAPDAKIVKLVKTEKDASPVLVTLAEIQIGDQLRLKADSSDLAKKTATVTDILIDIQESTKQLAGAVRVPTPDIPESKKVAIIKTTGEVLAVKASAITLQVGEEKKTLPLSGDYVIYTENADKVEIKKLTDLKAGQTVSIEQNQADSKVISVRIVSAQAQSSGL
jgi:hypothetical protein